MKAIHAIVEGEVQGVGFRYSAMREARALGVAGWVRNADDGTVEVWAEGDEAALEEFLAWLKVGPSAAWVRDVTLSWEAPKGTYTSFGIAF
ncbi:MAG: acylphosphatase [Rectinemataceae bacterium]|nr:acylphosphatase [Rectinemataceae bacterium]